MGLFDRKKKKETKPVMPSTSESGVSGDAVISSFDNELQRQDKIRIKDYRNMRDTDATVDSLYNIVTLPILSATFGVKPSEDDVDGEQAKFIERALFELPHKGGMDIPFSLILEQMLHALIDGFEVFERVYKYDEQTGKIVIKKMALRDAETVKIMINDKNSYGGVHQRASFGEKQVDVDIPADRTFLFTYSKADDNYYGRSAFKSCWRNWDKKQKLEYLDSISIQNSAIKPKILRRIGEAALKSNGDTKKALRALALLGQRHPTASIPLGFEVDELQGGDNSNVNEAIERQNSEMARSFLASFSLLGTQGSSNVGSYSLSSDQSSLFMIALKGTMKLIVDHINQYWIADLIDLNYPVGQRHYPTFYFDDLTDQNTELLRSAFTKLIEKDHLSADIVAGIEDKVATQLEIERTDERVEETTPPEPPEEPQEPTDDVDTNSDDEPPETPPEAPTKEEVKEDKEDKGNSAGKFRRELYDCERKIHFESIDRQSTKVKEDFEKKATELLGIYLGKVARQPEQPIKLPDEYVSLVRKTYKQAYNFGKLGASNEEEVKAPKTTELEKQHVDQYVDFIVKKQTQSIEDMIAEQKMKLPVTEEKVVRAEGKSDLLKNMIIGAALSLIPTMVSGTSGTIFSQGMNAGRNDVYATLDAELKALDDEAVATYMWTALLEHTCATCMAMDGATYTSEEKNSLEIQPGHVHINCNCFWVRMSGKGTPKATGPKSDVSKINTIQTVQRPELEKMGLVKNGETKANALRRATYNNQDNGNTIAEVSDNIRGQKIESLAVFDNKGQKIVDYSSGEAAAVSINNIDDFYKYLSDNKASIMIHNHPRGSSFSDTDIINAGPYDEIRIVSTSGDYSLKVGKSGWPDAAQLQQFYDSAYNKYNQQALAKINNGKMKGDSVAARWVLDHTVADVAKRFDLTYNKTK